MGQRSNRYIEVVRLDSRHTSTSGVGAFIYLRDRGVSPALLILPSSRAVNLWGERGGRRRVSEKGAAAGI
jgi:hypothetical protein